MQDNYKNKSIQRAQTPPTPKC